jgi:hypothetical protein
MGKALTDKNADTTVKKQRIVGKPFKPGKSGNPNGRPKGTTSIKDILRKIGMEEVELKDGTKTSKQQAIALKVYDKALDGEKWAVEFITNYTDGRPIETIRTQEIEKDEITVLNPKKEV